MTIYYYYDNIRIWRRLSVLTANVTTNGYPVSKIQKLAHDVKDGWMYKKRRTQNTNMYDTEFLKYTLMTIESELEDLSRWSVNNGDRGIDEIGDLKERFESVREALENDLWK